MNAAVFTLASLAILLLGYRVYGRLVARVVGVDPARPTPATTVNDGVDYVPTKPFVLFGHHYASIAAAGPITGPTLALMYGVMPAWLWMVCGVILIGAVHDFTALFVSMREGGKSIAEVARKVFGKPGFFLYLAFAIILCILVSAAFIDIAARALTSSYPRAEMNLEPSQTLFRTKIDNVVEKIVVGGVASTSAIVITGFAPVVGWLLYKRGGRVWQASVLAITGCALSVAVGFLAPVSMKPDQWMLVILVYSFVAGWVPVWLILQPRDFVNVHFLWAGLGVMSAGLLAAGFHGAKVNAPDYNVREAQQIADLGLLWPVLFVTVACGSVSGAHGLICGGTSSKQIAREDHAPAIGYGGMLMEAVLGVLVLLCVSTGLSFAEYKHIVWPGGTSGNPALGFAVGVAKTLEKGFGVNRAMGTVFGILLLEGFLLTTIDTVVRLTRYLLEELWKLLFNFESRGAVMRAVNTLIVAGAVYYFAANQGYLKMWKLFGSANQLLAALTLVVATAWLIDQRRRAWITALPSLFMVVTTVTALALSFKKYQAEGKTTLLVVDVILLALALGFLLLILPMLFRRKPEAAAA